MTEKQLKEYSAIGKKVARLSALYEEEGRKISTPRSPDITGMPRGCGGSEDKLCKALDTRSHLRSEINRLLKLQEAAYECLGRVLNELSSDTCQDVFICLYHKGLNVSQTADALKYSVAYIYKIRHEIRSIAANIEA
jgi:DNA-directed RNA polymerase specialized sigma24 family protein